MKVFLVVSVVDWEFQRIFGNFGHLISQNRPWYIYVFKKLNTFEDLQQAILNISKTNMSVESQK